MRVTVHLLICTVAMNNARGTGPKKKKAKHSGENAIQTPPKCALIGMKN